MSSSSSDELVVPARLASTSAGLPQKAHHNDGAADLYSAVALVIAPGERALVKTDLQLAIADGYAALVLPRSGLALKHGVTVANSPGLVDAGYRGDVGVILINHGQDDFSVEVGDRVAQLMIIRLIDWLLTQVDELPESLRGEGGFGSTGAK